MIRPPFRPPLFHEPGTSTDPNPRSDGKGTCCNRPDCCDQAASEDAESNPPALNSVAPSRKASKPASPATAAPVHRSPGC
jgi:hypothetical protein